MGACDSGNVRTDNSDGNAELFTGFGQVFSYETATTLKRTVLLAYPAHAVFLNVFESITQWLMNKEHLQAGLLPVCCIQK